jgi:hypothetical protein
MQNQNIRSTFRHQFSWMGFMYKRLVDLREYENLTGATRAEKLLAMYEKWESQPNMPKRERFSGTREERLKKMQRVIWFFEHEETVRLV